MKMFVASFALGILLVTGFAVAQDNPTDTTMEREPRVLSIGNTISL